MSQRRWLTENRPRGPPPTYKAQDPVIGEQLPEYTTSGAHGRQNGSEMFSFLNRETSPELGWFHLQQSSNVES